MVMSTHGYGGVKRIAFGSVALQIIHGYQGPIMTVRDEAPAVTPRLERLLIPVDGSSFSAAAIDRALDIVGDPYPALHLVRVLGTPAWAVPLDQPRSGSRVSGRLPGVDARAAR
ncbi:MAG: hypothetical protein R2849_10785 [Thermomicrobiales bacterium]